jgi:hypothetical protein
MSDDPMTTARVVPENFGPLREANGNARLTGPCGDTMEFWLGVAERRVARATFTTDGWSASRGSAPSSPPASPGGSGVESKRPQPVRAAAARKVDVHAALIIAEK